MDKKFKTLSDLSAHTGFIANERVYVEALKTWYMFIPNGSQYNLNGISVLPTSLGGNSRLIGISGKNKYIFHVEKPKNVPYKRKINGLSELTAQSGYEGETVFVQSLKTGYIYYKNNPSIYVDGSSAIKDPNDSTGVWVGVAGKHLYKQTLNTKPNEIAKGNFNISANTTGSAGGISGIDIRDENILLASGITSLNFVGNDFQASLDTPTSATISLGAPPPPANNIVSFIASPNVFEIGQSVTNEITFSWVANATPDTQSISPLIGSVTPNTALSIVSNFGPPLTTATTFTLQHVIGLDIFTRATNISFQRKVYWWTSLTEDFGNASKTYANLLGEPDFISSSVVNREEFSNTRLITKVIDASGGESFGGKFIYIMFPDSFGTSIPQLRVNQFPVTLSYTKVISFTNESGGITNYRIYRTGRQNGTSIPIEVL